MNFHNTRNLIAIAFFLIAATAFSSQEVQAQESPTEGAASGLSAQEQASATLSKDRSGATLVSPSAGQAALNEASTVHQIQLGAFSKDANVAAYVDLSDVGYIESIPRGAHQKVFVGPYMGRESAAQALQVVRRRGFQDAFIDASTVDLFANANRVVQLGAYNSLDMSRFDDLEADLYVLVEKNVYKVVTLPFDAQNPPADLAGKLGYFKAMGFGTYVRPVN